MIHSHHFSAVLTATDPVLGLSPPALLALLKRAVREAGLHPVGELAVTFVPQGLSAVLVLEESHVALHVWPEIQKVAVDIHVCNYHQNNLPKAQRLTELLEQEIAGTCDRAQWNYLFAAG